MNIEGLDAGEWLGVDGHLWPILGGGLVAPRPLSGSLHLQGMTRDLWVVRGGKHQVVGFGPSFSVRSMWFVIPVQAPGFGWGIPANDLAVSRSGRWWAALTYSSTFGNEITLINMDDSSLNDWISIDGEYLSNIGVNDEGSVDLEFLTYLGGGTIRRRRGDSSWSEVSDGRASSGVYFDRSATLVGGSRDETTGLIGPSARAMWWSSPPKAAGQTRLSGRFGEVSLKQGQVERVPGESQKGPPEVLEFPDSRSKRWNPSGLAIDTQGRELAAVMSVDGDTVLGWGRVGEGWRGLRRLGEAVEGPAAIQPLGDGVLAVTLGELTLRVRVTTELGSESVPQAQRVEDLPQTVLVGAVRVSGQAVGGGELVGADRRSVDSARGLSLSASPGGEAVVAWVGEQRWVERRSSWGDGGGFVGALWWFRGEQRGAAILRGPVQSVAWFPDGRAVVVGHGRVPPGWRDRDPEPALGAGLTVVHLESGERGYEVSFDDAVPEELDPTTLSRSVRARCRTFAGPVWRSWRLGGDWSEARGGEGGRRYPKPPERYRGESGPGWAAIIGPTGRQVLWEPLPGPPPGAPTASIEGGRLIVGEQRLPVPLLRGPPVSGVEAAMLTPDGAHLVWVPAHPLVRVVLLVDLTTGEHIGRSELEPILPPTAPLALAPGPSGGIELRIGRGRAIALDLPGGVGRP